MISLKQLVQFLKEEWVRFKNFINADKIQQDIIDSFKNYVPRYYRRTEAEHDEIRRRIAVSPSVCRHLKGSPRRSRNASKDYNVSFHTFIDGTKRIRCLTCGKKWFPSSPDWQTAVDMMDDSTNTCSASEIPVSWCVIESDGTRKIFNNSYDASKAYMDALSKVNQSNSQENNNGNKASSAV